MLLIEKVVTREVPDGPYELMHMPKLTISLADDGSDISEVYGQFVKEVVFPRTFIDENGKRQIGMTEQAQKEIGIIFEAFSYLNEEVSSMWENNKRLREDKDCLEKELKEYENMSLVQKFKRLFSSSKQKI